MYVCESVYFAKSSFAKKQWKQRKNTNNKEWNENGQNRIKTKTNSRCNLLSSFYPIHINIKRASRAAGVVSLTVILGGSIIPQTRLFTPHNNVHTYVCTYVRVEQLHMEVWMCVYVSQCAQCLRWCADAHHLSALYTFHKKRIFPNRFGFQRQRFSHCHNAATSLQYCHIISNFNSNINFDRALGECASGCRLVVIPTPMGTPATDLRPRLSTRSVLLARTHTEAKELSSGDESNWGMPRRTMPCCATFAGKDSQPVS